MKTSNKVPSHNACYGLKFTFLGKTVYGFNVNLGDVVWMRDVEKYGVVTSIDSCLGSRPCFYVTTRLSSGEVCEFPFTDLDCHYCVIPASDTVVRLPNGVARLGSLLLDTAYLDQFVVSLSKIDLARGRCFVRPFSRNISVSSGYWCPISELVLYVKTN